MALEYKNRVKLISELAVASDYVTGSHRKIRWIKKKIKKKIKFSLNKKKKESLKGYFLLLFGFFFFLIPLKS